MKRLALLTLMLALLSAGALAQPQPLYGTVHALTPQGAVISTPNAMYLVPTNTVTFEVAGVRVQYGSLAVGQTVQTYLPAGYVLNPYQCMCPACQARYRHDNGKHKGHHKHHDDDDDDD